MNLPLDRNRQRAIAFYDLMFNQCRPAEAITFYVGDSYTQHNPHVADGKRVTVKRSVAEGDLVVLHCHQHLPGDTATDWAGIDIFRFDAHGKIVEHWDVLQVVPDASAHDNTMF